MACQTTSSGSSSCNSSAPAMPPPPVGAFDTSTPLLHLSDAVVSKVSAMLAEENDPQLKLRIFVTGGGCSGFQYGFSFDDARKDDDLMVERDGMAVLVDAMSMQYLQGALIDYEDSLEGSRFVIRNPNATSTCGCGSSFNV